jgi:protein-S-isoprenylcysteine O-methyltransferase Ste14
VILFLKNLVFTLVLPGTMAVYLPLWINGGRPPAPWGLERVLAVPLFACGAALYFWCLWHFAVEGRATPAPIDAPKILVVNGPYRYVRNPMYLGVVLVMIGWALWFRNADIAWYVAIWLVFVNTFVMLYEEPTLTRLFGEQYDHYRANVGRWLPGKRYR